MPMSAPEETLYLIDGYSALFRAFYAIRNPLYSPVTGEPTNATLVFAQMLLKLYITLAPGFVVVAWDAPGKTFRDVLYTEYARIAADQPDHADAPPSDEPSAAPPRPETEPIKVLSAPSYKGTRRETPDALHEQTPRVLQLLEIFGIPLVGASGLEADDVIATLTTRVLALPDYPALRVRIATRDKDMEQLIGDRTTLFDIHTGAEMDKAALWSKRGILPEQVVDFLALTGDTVDNIPGVPNVGPKTAARLLQQFGSLDGIVSAMSTMRDKTMPGSASGKVWESLARARPYLPVSRRLVTLESNADIPFDLEQARVRPFPTDALLQFCDEVGFNTFKKQCLAAQGARREQP